MLQANSALCTEIEQGIAGVKSTLGERAVEINTVRARLEERITVAIDAIRPLQALAQGDGGPLAPNVVGAASARS